MAELGTVFVDVKGDYDSFAKESKSSITGIAGKAAAAFAGAFVVKEAFDFGKASVDAASTLGESVNAVQQSFDKLNGEKLLALGDTAAATMGMSESAFNAFSVRVSGFANQIAGPGGDSAKVVEDLGGRIADFASVMNLDMEQATTVFTQSMAGETEAAKRFGKDVGDAAVKAYALENGIWDGTGAMDAQQLATARLGNLMAQTENVAGDFANTSGGLANQQRIMAAEMENAKAAVGAALLPALEALMPVIRDTLVPLIEKLAPLFGLVGQALGAIGPPVLSLIGMLLPLITDILTPLIPLFTLVADVVLQLVTPILELVGKAIKPLMSIIQRLLPILADALAPVLDVLATLFDALWPIIEIVFALLEPLLPVVELLANIIGAILTVAVEYLVKALQWLAEKLQPVIGFASKLAEVLQGGLSKLLPNLLQWFRELPGKILEFVSGAGKWLVDTGRDLIQGFIDGIKRTASNIINTIKRFVTDKIPGFVKDALGIGSPSKVMLALGREVPRGMAIGITKSAPLVSRAMAGLVQTPGLGVNAFGSIPAMASPIGMTFNAPVGGDLGMFSQQVMDAAAREQRYANG